MCGRYAVTTDPATLAAEIDAVNEVPADLDAPGRRAPGVSYNVAPTSSVMTVVKRHDRSHPDDDARLRVRAMRWGLVPGWAKEVGKGPLLFNARAETAATKSAFRAAVRSRRCLIPMDGWYEWRVRHSDARGKPAKIPYFMSPADGTRVFLAGLWSVWHDRAGELRPARSAP
ncbi:MAG: SOS response-associated peptidase, partial [Gordonia sp. (in: high G+C Gram-positive bacteria)]